MSELFSIYGETNGTNVTGNFSLDSDIFYASVDNIRIPKGAKLKLWAKRLYGVKTRVIVKYTNDVTAATPIWVEKAGGNYLVSEGEITPPEKLKPILFRGYNGKEAIQISWEQPTGAAGKARVNFEVEIET